MLRPAVQPFELFEDHRRDIAMRAMPYEQVHMAVIGHDPLLV